MPSLSAVDTDEADEDMARSAARPIDTARAEALSRKLKLAIRDTEAFATLRASIEADKSLTAQDVMAIAHAFAGGAKPKSRKAALIAIGQERMRVLHSDAKAASAAKTRTW
jgi:hypothetical protein